LPQVLPLLASTICCRILPAFERRPSCETERWSHDFLFVESERMLHVCNAPSPAATSSLRLEN
jgi:hypothetical protein